MYPLVSQSNLADFKYISDSVHNSKLWPQFVSEAQLFDVKTWLGDALLNEIVTQAEAAALTGANVILLNGGSYLYQDKTYLFQGLKVAIMYYAFARFTNETSVNWTANGLVIKDSDLSTPASDKRIQRLETNYRLMGDSVRDETIQFLNRNHTLYPLYTSLCSRNIQRSRTFTVIGD